MGKFTYFCSTCGPVSCLVSAEAEIFEDFVVPLYVCQSEFLVLAGPIWFVVNVHVILLGAGGPVCDLVLAIG